MRSALPPSNLLPEVRQRIAELIDALRSAGLRVSLAEALDAHRAVAAVGIEPAPLREGLATALVKHEEDRPVFDALFDRLFSPPAARRLARGHRRTGSAAGVPAAGGGRGGTDADQAGRRPAGPAEPEGGHGRTGRHEGRAERREQGMRTRGPRPGPSERGAREEDPNAGAARRGPGLANLSGRPFTGMTPRELEAAREVARELGRRLAAGRARRRRRLRRGRVDVRRTIRASLSRGGVPFSLERRGRRPAEPDLVALCDVSGSVAEASELLLSLLAGAEGAFRSVHRFAFVDRLVPVDFEGGRIRPDGSIDLWARSDTGSVLCELERDRSVPLGRRAVLLVLGDARNNRRPARADALSRIASRCRAVVWAVPEPRGRWGTGDSALASYQRHCRAVVEATSLRGMRDALRRALEPAAVAARLRPG